MKTLKLFFLILFSIQTLLTAQGTKVNDPDPHRFDKEINAFITYDQKNSFPQDAILFVGSSSIRLWKTHLAFPEFPVINRGFGGAHISDVLFFYDEVVKKYQPQLVIFYCGDNDIAAGKPVDQVVNDFKTFWEKMKNDFPGINLIYVPIKPSVARWKFWPAMNQANQKIKEFLAAENAGYYADLASVLLTPDGNPDSSLFIEDGLHLNAKGYQKWNQALLPLLKKIYKK